MLVNFEATLSISGKCASSFVVVRVNAGHISRRETLQKCYFIIQIVRNKDMVQLTLIAPLRDIFLHCVLEVKSSNCSVPEYRP